MAMLDGAFVFQEPGSSPLLSAFREAARGSKAIRVASGFISSYAAERLLDAIPESTRPVVIAGRDPSRRQVEGMARLRERADVYVYAGEGMFHPKVYIFERDDQLRVLVGSSNFTGGGFADNVELDLDLRLNAGDSAATDLTARFESWLSKSVPLTNELLAALRREAAIYDEARDLADGDPQVARARSEIDKAIADERRRQEEERRARAASRPFFTEAHRAAFEVSKHFSNDGRVNAERRVVSQRLLELHDELLPEIRARGWDLHQHHHPQHITSSWHLVPGFVSTINAMWLPYGRAKERFDGFRLPGEKEEQEFFNHAKLQVLVNEEHVYIGMMMAQRHNAWDREYLRRKLGIDKNASVQVEPDRIVSVLGDAGRLEPTAVLERSNDADSNDNEELRLPDLDREKLMAFVRRAIPGNWVGLWVKFDPNVREVDETNILGTSLRVFEHLYPVYELLAYYPGKR